MMEQIKLFLFILSLIYNFRFIIEFVVKLFQENPSILKISKTDQVFLYFSISYFITYFFIN